MMKIRFARLALLVVLVAAIALVYAYRDLLDVTAFETWVKQMGAAGPVMFMLIYTVATILFLPGSALTLAGGALFGPVLGTFYSLTGATLGATLSFLVSRYLASDWIEARVGGRMKQVKEGVEGEGWHFVAFARLMPLFPFNALNYALGMTRIRLSHYVIATYVCMLPGAFAYTYLGYAGREAVAGSEGLIQKSLLALALLALVAFLPRLIGRLRSGPMLGVDELRQRLDGGDDLLLLDVRTAEDFVGEQRHIDGAVNIPVEALAGRMEDIVESMERPVAVICRTDRRSAKAAQILARSGFADVHVVRGGMTDWLKHGYPVA